MNMEKIFTKKELTDLFDKLKRAGPVFTPVREEDDINTLKPIKEFFFRQRELVYQTEKAQKRALWGIRPCEAAGLLILDKVYLANPCDDTYKVLRENTLLIGQSCLRAGENCFCKFINGSPFSREGLDILITELNPDKFYLEGISVPGQDLISSSGTPAREEKTQRKELEEKANQSFRRQFKVPENLPGLFDSAYWEQVSHKCISCGICRFLCPTCHCFDLGMEEGERVKYWDACAFKRFTQEASGVNPRFKKADRYKQWVYHKYDYFKKRQGLHLCVGCGRCVTKCPTKMDIIDIFSKAPEK